MSERTTLIAEFMTKKLITIGLDTELKEVGLLFEEKQIHHLLVLDDDHKTLLGVVSDRDYLKHVSPNLGTTRFVWNDLESLDQPVHKIMSRKLITLSPSNNLSDVIETFKKHKISCIPIIVENCEVVGIVTWRDLLNLI